MEAYLPGFKVSGTLSKFGGMLYTCGVKRIWGSFVVVVVVVEGGDGEAGEHRKLSGDI